MLFNETVKNSDALTATLSALADPTRRAILARLADGEATVNELAEPFEISLPAISRHLKVLEGAGLISRGRTAQWRPCRLQAAPLRDVEAWLERYRRFWEGSFERMDDYLASLKATDPHHDKPRTTPQTTPKGDDDGA
jgi:DNA-binding transcriptional ArsR family regulator